MRRLLRTWLSLAAALVCLGAEGLAQVSLPDLDTMPGIKKASFQNSHRVEGEGWRLWGDVKIEAGQMSLLADEVYYDENSKTIDATGNVVLTAPGMVVSGTRLFYNVEEETGEILDAVGYLEFDGAILRAEKIVLLGERRMMVERALFTTCTQPTPYWSFRIRRGTFDLGEYAYLRGVAFKAGKLPVFYTPYLVWPIKEERASGFLFPEFGSSDNLGQSIRVPYYWAFAPNADVTFNIDGYTKVGFGIDTELRWLPTPTGEAEGRLRYVNDQVRDKSRYAIEWRHRQELPLDFNLTADIELYSDFDYATDYETDLIKAATPQTVSTIDVSKAWSWYTLAMRTRLHNQYFVASAGGSSVLTGQVVNNQLPEIELRSRSHRIGGSPVYFSFESSLAGFSKRILNPPEGSGNVESEEDLVTTVDNSWARVDVGPRLRLPLLKAPWADFELVAAWQGTWYSHSVAPDSSDRNVIVSEPIFRSLWSAGFNFSGPRIQRIFETPRWGYSPKLKHVIEPFVSYNWRPEPGVESSELIVFDEVDAVPRELSDVRYGIRQRFYAQRPPQTGRNTGLATAEESSFDALEEQAEQEEKREQAAEERDDADDKLAVGETLNPVEIGSIEISQSYSFVRDISPVYSRLLDGETGLPLIDEFTGLPQTTIIDYRSFSPISITARFNPTQNNSVDVGYTFDPANDVLTETRISTLLGLGRRGFLEAKWYRRRSADPGIAADSSFLRTRWGTTVSSRFSFQIDWDYNLETGKMDHQFYQVRYATQCCSFHLGYDERAFVDNDRKEFRLVINLKGVGELLDLKDTR